MVIVRNGVNVRAESVDNSNPLLRTLVKYGIVNIKSKNKFSVYKK